MGPLDGAKRCDSTPSPDRHVEDKLRIGLITPRLVVLLFLALLSLAVGERLPQPTPTPTPHMEQFMQINRGTTRTSVSDVGVFRGKLRGGSYTNAAPTPTPMRDPTTLPQGRRGEEEVTNRKTRHLATITGVPASNTFFPFSGSEQAWPNSASVGVGTVTIYACGGQGAPSPTPNAGGLGGYIQATVPVTAGQTYYVYVGGGWSPTANPASVTLNVANLYNGGGLGSPPRGNAAYGGGGASDFRSLSVVSPTTTPTLSVQPVPSLNTRLVVAGGGGAAGGGNDGGDGGAATGQTGAGSGGGGGTQSTFGAAQGTCTAAALGLGGGSPTCQGGGGGYYGGGGAANDAKGGGGGSNFPPTGSPNLQGSPTCAGQGALYLVVASCTVGYSFASGACSACAGGSYQDVAAQTVCNTCVAGRYTPPSPSPTILASYYPFSTHPTGQALAQGTLLGTVSLPAKYVVSFDIYPNAIAGTELSSIIYLNALNGGSDNSAGSRLPAVFFNPGTTRLGIRYNGYTSATQAVITSSATTGILPLTTWYVLLYPYLRVLKFALVTSNPVDDTPVACFLPTITHKHHHRHKTHDRSTVTITVDTVALVVTLTISGGTVSASQDTLHANAAATWSNVRVYASSPITWAAADADIRNLAVVSSGNTVCTACGTGFTSATPFAACTTCSPAPSPGAAFPTAGSCSSPSNCPAGTAITYPPWSLSVTGITAPSTTSPANDWKCVTPTLTFNTPPTVVGLSIPCRPWSPPPTSLGCISCNMGYYTPTSTGAASCTACAAGTSNAPTGFSSASGCPGCAAGSYQDVTAQMYCKACAGGKYQDVTAQTACKNCATGKYTPLATSASYAATSQALVAGTLLGTVSLPAKYVVSFDLLPKSVTGTGWRNIIYLNALSGGSDGTAGSRLPAVFFNSAAPTMGLVIGYNGFTQAGISTAGSLPEDIWYVVLHLSSYVGVLMSMTCPD